MCARQGERVTPFTLRGVQVHEEHRSCFCLRPVIAEIESRPTREHGRLWQAARTGQPTYGGEGVTAREVLGSHPAWERGQDPASFQHLFMRCEGKDAG